MTYNQKNEMKPTHKVMALALVLILSPVVYAMADHVSEAQIKIFVAMIEVLLIGEFIRTIRSRRFDDVPLLIGVGVSNLSIFASPPWKMLFAGITIGIVIALIFQRVFSAQRN